MIKKKKKKMKKTFASASKKIKTKKNASKLAEKMQNFIKRKISEQGKINKENPNQQKVTSKKKESNDIDINFFYTNDKFINSFDDNDIISYIHEKYPEFMKIGCKDIEIKKHIIMMLQDKTFINNVLEYFNLSLFDFFQFLFRRDTSIFKGPFLNKVARIVKEKKYKI